jgi:hypothetical protein
MKFYILGLPGPSGDHHADVYRSRTVNSPSTDIAFSEVLNNKRGEQSHRLVHLYSFDVYSQTGPITYRSIFRE